MEAQFETPVDAGIAEHLDALRAAAFRLAGPAEADELVQDAVASAMEARPPSHPELTRAWLLQILRRRWYDALRRRAVERRAVPARPSESPDGALVRAALESMGAEDRRLLEWRFYDGRTSAEIGATLKRPAGTVRSMIFYALKRFEAAFRAVAEGAGR